MTAPVGQRPTPTPRRHLLALVAALVAVGSVWLANATRDVPYVHHPDEPTNLRVVDAMVSNGDFNPHYFYYPSLVFYVHAAAHLEGPFLGWAGHDENPPGGPAMGTNRTDTPGSLRVHRAISVLFGLATVAAVYATSRRLTGQTATSALAAAVRLTSVTLTANAQFVAPDVIAAAACAAVLWAAVRLWQRPTTGWHLVAGVAVGLAASAKYNAVLVASTVVAASLLAPGLRAELRRRFASLTAAGLASLVTFALITPYALLDRSAFLEDVRFVRDAYATGHDGMDGQSLRWYVDYLLTSETILVVLAAAGAATAFSAGRRRVVALVCVFPVAYGLLAVTQEVRNHRTILLVLPHLAVLVALGAASALPWLRSRPRPARLAAGSAALALVAVQVSQVVGVLSLGPAAHFEPQRLGHLELGESTWVASRNWIDENLPEGSRVLVESYSPWVDPVRFDVEGVHSLSSLADPHDPSWTYLVASEEVYRRAFDAPGDPRREAYERLFAENELLVEFDGPGPTIRVLRVTPDPEG